MRARKAGGISLVELLVALAIFGTVMAIAYAAIHGSLRIQADQEAATTVQGKLRRVVEVLTQDLRSSVFGSITNAPYASGAGQISFMMLTGGAGHVVLPPPSLNDFPSSGEILVQMPDARHLEGSEIVMINGATGTGVVLPVSSVSPGAAAGTWRVGSSTCRNTIRYAQNSMLLFEVETVGIRYDEADQAIMIATAGGPEAPFAFGISDFGIDYVYTTPGEPPRSVSSPRTGTGGVPIRSYQDGGDTYTLQRVQFSVSALAESRGRSIEHAYTGQIDLSRTEHFTVEEIVPCA